MTTHSTSLKLFYLFAFLLLIKTSVSAQAVFGTISGTVIDRQNHQPIAKARVAVPKLKRTVMADSLGQFTIHTITPGLYTFTVVGDGYDSLHIYNIHIKSGINNDQRISLKKSREVDELSKMTIVASSIDQKRAMHTTSVTKVTNFELNNTPGTVNDVNQVLGTLPSTVIGIGEGFDNNLYVRGGNSAENIFIVDGIELDNISHFSSVDQSGGAIGFLNPSLIHDLDFFAGGIPANMPPRLSSVTDIHIRDGSFTDRKYQVDLNASGLGVTLEGPLIDNKLSYLLNSRIVYLKFLKAFLDEIDGIPFYGDSHLKMSLKATPKDKFTLNAIYSFDNYKEDSYWYLRTDSLWYLQPTEYRELQFTYAGGINWEHIFNSGKAKNNLLVSAVKRDFISKEDLINYNPPPVQRQTTTAVTKATVADTGRFWSKTFFTSDKAYEESDKREHVSIKDDFSFFLRENDQLEMGVNAKYQRYTMRNQWGQYINGFYGVYERDTVNNVITITDTLGYWQENPFDRDSTKTGYEVGGYLQYIFKQDWFKLITGFRGDYYSIFRDHAISPRCAMSINSGKSGIFSFSYGMYYQTHAELNDIFFQFMVPNPNFDMKSLKLYELELQRNHQFVLGYEKYFKDMHYLSAEAYYKLYDREYQYINPYNIAYVDTATSNPANPLYDPHWYHLNKPRGKKRVYGLELLFQKKKYDSFYYSLGYSLFFAENKYTNGKYYRDKNEMRNTFSCIVGTNFWKHHGLALRIAAMEGRPYVQEKLVGAGNNKYTVLDTTVEYYSKRFDPMFYLNLRYTFKLYKKWGNVMGYIDILNVLNQSPTTERFFRRSTQKFVERKVNGIMPVAGITVDF